MSSNRRQDEGFSLIELLVVITILATLAAIAIPSFIAQRQRAAQAAMAADLHAIVTAQLAWSMEHGDTFTTNPADLTPEGYRPSANVTALVSVTGAGFEACTRHTQASSWLVYNSTSAQTSRSASSCA